MDDVDVIMSALLSGAEVGDEELEAIGKALFSSKSVREQFREMVSIELSVGKYVSGITVPSILQHRVLIATERSSEDANSVKGSHDRSWAIYTIMAIVVAVMVLGLFQMIAWYASSPANMRGALTGSSKPLAIVKDDPQGVLNVKRTNSQTVKKYQNGTVGLITPNGSEEYVVGSVIPIRWAPGRDNKSWVEYSPDGGANWSPLYGVKKGQTGWLWKMSSSRRVTSAALMRVVVENDNIIEPRLVRTLYAHDSGAAIAEIATGGERLLTVGADAEMYLWDLPAGKRELSMSGHTGHITYAKVSHNGEYVASCSQDGSVQVWSLNTGEQLHFLIAPEPEQGVPWSVGWDPGDTTLAVGNDDGSITFWDLSTGTVLKSVGGRDKYPELGYHNEAIRFIEYTVDGKKIMTASSDTRAAIMDVESGKIENVFQHHKGRQQDGSQSLEDRKVALRRKVVNGIQMAQNGNVVITCGYDGVVKYWDVNTGKLLRERVYHSGMQVSSLALSHGGRWVVSTGYDGSAKIIEVQTGEVVAHISLEGYDTSLVARASFSQDDRYLAIAQWSGRVTLWRLNKVESMDVSDATWSIVPCEESVK